MANHKCPLSITGPQIEVKDAFIDNDTVMWEVITVNPDKDLNCMLSQFLFSYNYLIKPQNVTKQSICESALMLKTTTRFHLDNLKCFFQHTTDDAGSIKLTVVNLAMPASTLMSFYTLFAIPLFETHLLYISNLILLDL